MSFFVQVCLLSTLSVTVLALAPCQQQTIRNLEESGDCYFDLKKAPADSPFIVLAAPEVEISPVVECVYSKIDQPNGDKYHVTSTYQLTNGSFIKNEYTHIEKACGDVNEYSTVDNTLYELHFASSKYPEAKVFGYYRCSQSGTDSHASGYCVVSAAHRYGNQVEAALADCKATLENAGVAKLANLNPKNCKV